MVAAVKTNLTSPFIVMYALSLQSSAEGALFASRLLCAERCIVMPDSSSSIHERFQVPPRRVFLETRLNLRGALQLTRSGR
jgi:hypothetical protein